MKIGILSINTHTKGLNYACPVHTYAFQQFLMAYGVESTAIDYKANYYGDFEPRHPGEYYEKLYQNQLKKWKNAPEEKKESYEEKLNTLREKADVAVKSPCNL